jgi:hypothetical protein
MIERERQAFDLLICAVKQIVYGEFVRLIDVFRSMNRLQHRPNDDVWINDGKVKGGFVVFEKFPRSLLGQFLRSIVSQDRAFRLDSRIRSHLERWSARGQQTICITGGPCSSLSQCNPFQLHSRPGTSPIQKQHCQEAPLA